MNFRNTPSTTETHAATPEAHVLSFTAPELPLALLSLEQVDASLGAIEALDERSKAAGKVAVGNFNFQGTVDDHGSLTA